MKHKNVWHEFGPYPEYGERWRESLEIEPDDVLTDLTKTFVETGETRNTSPNGVQCTIDTPRVDGQICTIDAITDVYAIRDTNGKYWVMLNQIECELC